MKRTVSFLFLVITTVIVYGQQDPQYTNYMFYKMGVNPGFAGADESINGMILNRYQWAGFDGGEPRTLVFSVDAAVDLFGKKSGVGLNVVSDQLGFYDNTWVNLNYSYKLTTALGELGIGISPGIYNFSINPDDGWTSSDDVLNNSSGGSGDNLIPQGEASQIALDLGFGLYLHNNKYYAGISVTHLNQPEIKYDDLAVDFLVRHYYLTGGYNIKLSDPLFELRPSFLIKSDLAAWQMDLNINVFYNEQFWGGISYRVQDAIVLLLGTELFNGLRVGYSFDLTTSAIGRNSLGSHEIFISYSIDLERNRSQKYKSVRFL